MEIMTISAAEWKLKGAQPERKSYHTTIPTKQYMLKSFIIKNSDTTTLLLNVLYTLCYLHALTYVASLRWLKTDPVCGATDLENY